MLTGRLSAEPVFLFWQNILEAFPGSECFLVGGAVRDAILNRPSKDYDFIVRGVKAEALQEFLSSIGIVNLVGRTFGVFKFVPLIQYEDFKVAGLEPFDIALPRTEQAGFSGGYKDFNVQSDSHLPIEKDLERRDFTMNAMAVRLIGMRGQGSGVSGELIDPFRGAEDIEKKNIRAVGKPEDRFQEDYSRMLRALRLACELEFEIEERTFRTIENMASSLNDKQNGDWVVPRETIAKEFLRGFFAAPVRAFDLCDTSGVFHALLPEVIRMKHCPQPPEYHAEGDVFVHTRLALQKLESAEYQKIFSAGKPDAETVMAVLFHDIGKPPTMRTPEEHGTDRIRFDEHPEVGADIVRVIVRRLKLDSQPSASPLHVSEDHLAWLIKNHLLLLHGDPKEMRASTVEKYFFNPLAPGDTLMRLAWCDGSATIPASGAPDLSSFQAMRLRIDEVGRQAKFRGKLPPPLLDGVIIMETLHLEPGPRVGEIIRLLREEQLEGRLATREEAIIFINKLPKTV